MKSSQTIFAGFWILQSLIIGGCQSTQVGPTRSMVRTELFVGLSRPSGPDITEAEFAGFLEEVVTPRFPDGYTVVPAEGRWRDPRVTAKTVKESSRVLIFLHLPDVATNEKIEEIRKAYKSRFAQEAVLRVDDVEMVAF